MTKILEAIKEFIINLINKLFKKVEDNIPDDLGANWHGPFEADPRDFKAENVLGGPTAEELKNLPSKVDLLEKAKPKKYQNQGCVPSCTCSSLANGMTLSECIERDNPNIEVFQKYLREKLGHKWTCKGEKGDYLENALKTLKKYKARAEILELSSKKIEYLGIDGYAYSNTTKDNMKYYLSKGYPLYFAFRGDRNTWSEMSKGEVLTTKFTPTGGHAVIAYGYDENYLYFMNSWRVNDGEQYKGDYSVFKISWTNLSNMLQNSLANRRFWIFYNHNDNPMLFKDYKGEPGTEQYEAVKFMKDNKIVKGVPHQDGQYLEGDRPVTRLELIVILYRILKTFILKK